MDSESRGMEAIREKVEAGQRLSFDDGLALEASNDLFALGSMANLVRERYNGNFAYYNVNTHINPTNVCVYTCDFCAFRADLGEDRAYVMDRDQIVERARQASARGATELHIVGGLHHKLPFGYYLDVVRWIKETAPEIHIKAYTAVEIELFCKIARKSVEDVLRELIDAGLGSLPGGGAEIFHPEVREQICGAKASTESWLNIHRTAHRLGLHSNATMLYGHIDGPKHRIDHLVRLRELQDETGGFQTFIPLAFHPDNSADGPHPQALGRDGPEGHGDQPADARQLPAHQGVLGHAGAQDGAGRPLVRGRRPRRHRRPREDLPRGRRRDAARSDRRRDPPPDRRGRPRSRRARYALSSRRARRRHLARASTSTCPALARWRGQRS